MSTSVGKPINRIDGRLKVSGGAKYSADFNLPQLAHAVQIQSTIASGRIRTIDTQAALLAPGVLAIITHLINCCSYSKYPFDSSFLYISYFGSILCYSFWKIQSLPALF